jgi:hypothetical protein
MEDAMVKELEVNNETAQDHERQPQKQSGDKPNRQQLQGKSSQINKNSVEDKQPSRSPALPRRGAGDKPNQQKLQGKSLQINKNSVED